MTGERVAVTSNGREYTWRGTRWTYEPKNNHGRTEVHRTSRLHYALCELHSLRAQVAALAVSDAMVEAFRKGYEQCETQQSDALTFTHAQGIAAGLRLALDAARGGEG